MDLQNKILSTILDIQTNINDLDERMARIEIVQEKVNNKLD